jgi:hemerythrin-like domain-containing protein
LAPTDTSREKGMTEPGLDLRISSETRRMLGQHSQLHTFFDLVREGLERGSLQAVRLAFTRFRDAIEAHMDVEDNAYFPALRGLRPHLAPQLAQLVLDHARSREEIEEMYELLARGSAEEFRDRFSAFCDAFASHEAREEALSVVPNAEN